MAYLQIPIDPNQPDHEFSIQLDGTIFLLRFQLNSRTKRWLMTLKQEDGTVLVNSIPLVTNWPLLQRYKKLGMPLGEIFVSDDTETYKEVTEDSFNETHSIWYREVGTE